MIELILLFTNYNNYWLIISMSNAIFFLKLYLIS